MTGNLCAPCACFRPASRARRDRAGRPRRRARLLLRDLSQRVARRAWTIAETSASSRTTTRARRAACCAACTSRSAPASAKLVRCARGQIVDVAVDLRAGSPTYGRWERVELDDESMRELYVPVGFAHGFCVLSDVADVIYKQTAYYDPQLERGIAWNDPDVGIEWPLPRERADRLRARRRGAAAARVEPTSCRSSTTAREPRRRRPRGCDAGAAHAHRDSHRLGRPDRLGVGRALRRARLRRASAWRTTCARASSAREASTAHTTERAARALPGRVRSLAIDIRDRDGRRARVRRARRARSSS